jgi:sensor histidine kinase YesM
VVLDSVRRPDVDHQQRLLAAERDRAERLLNVVRLVVLALLCGAALAYAPSLPRALNVVNASLLAITVSWTVGQHRIFYQRERLPDWLSVTNSVVDVTAVTVLIASYGFAYSAQMALKAPVVAAYFVILAAVPVASSTRKAALISGLAVVEYAVVILAFVLSGTLTMVVSPVAASTTAAVSWLDEGAKLLLLACAGAVATYAAHWQEQLSRRFSEAARESEQLQARLDQARLQALRLQLQPHFLFNTLNTISALMHRDVDAADAMIARLSDLLRMSLQRVGVQEVPLKEELDFLSKYLEIEQTRFRDRLTVVFDVQADTLDALVPNLLLQPLVENAIKHGIGPRPTPGQIAVRARRNGALLELDVQDNGVGLSAARLTDFNRGVGLSNTRSRLDHLYGSLHRFEFRQPAEGGLLVCIAIPMAELAVEVGEGEAEAVA